MIPKMIKLTEEEFFALSMDEQVKMIKEVIKELGMTESEAIEQFMKSRFYKADKPTIH